MKIRDIQQQLAARGYTPGAIDGIWAKQTIAAIRAFLIRHGLTPDGIGGPVPGRGWVDYSATAGGYREPE